MKIEAVIGGETYQISNRYSVRDQAGANSVSSVDVKAEAGQAIPRALQSIELLLDGEVFFFGIIDSVEAPEYSTGKEVSRYRLSLSSATKILQWRRVIESLTNIYTSDIVQTIFENYIETEGIELGSIATTDRFYESYVANYDLTVKACLDELADAVGASYFIGADHKFYFCTRSELSIIDAPVHITKLSREESADDVRTVQTVLGASEETTVQTYGAAWTTGQVAVTLSYQISSITGATINGTTVGVGYLGLDEDDTTKTFLYTIGSQNVSLNANATTKPSAGDLVGLVYTGYYDIIVTNENSQLLADVAALSGTSGKIENVLSDETLSTFADADSQANALLEANGTIEQNLSCVFVDITALDKTQIMTVWRFNRVDLGIVGDFVITERTIEDFFDKFRVTVKLSNNKLSQRYGTTLTAVEKKVRPEQTVYKQSLANDTLAAVIDAISFDSAGILQYPTTGASIFDPGLPGFYPT